MTAAEFLYKFFFWTIVASILFLLSPAVFLTSVGMCLSLAVMWQYLEDKEDAKMDVVLYMMSVVFGLFLFLSLFSSFQFFRSF